MLQMKHRGSYNRSIHQKHHPCAICGEHRIFQKHNIAELDRSSINFFLQNHLPENFLWKRQRSREELLTLEAKSNIVLSVKRKRWRLKKNYLQTVDKTLIVVLHQSLGKSHLVSCRQLKGLTEVTS